MAVKQKESKSAKKDVPTSMDWRERNMVIADLCDQILERAALATTKDRHDISVYLACQIALAILDDSVKCLHDLVGPTA